MTKGAVVYVSLTSPSKVVEATREQQQDVVFALIMYLNGACYLEDGHIRRMFEATRALGTERAIREATKRMEVLRAAAVYSTVEAVVSAILESPDSLERVKLVVEELKAAAAARGGEVLACLVPAVVHSIALQSSGAAAAGSGGAAAASLARRGHGRRTEHCRSVGRSRPGGTGQARTWI